MAMFLLKIIGLWLVMVVMAIINAVIREKVLIPIIGARVSLPVSGILLSIFVFIIVYLSIPFFSQLESKLCVTIGVIWVIFTLSFEFLFGHFVAGKPWNEIIQVFNVKKGDLFILVLITSFISPWLAAKIRDLI